MSARDPPNLRQLSFLLCCD